MELGWNGMEYLVESHREGNGNGMERNYIFRWNWNGMEVEWNGSGITMEYVPCVSS